MIVDSKSHEYVQIDAAARGCVSGTLTEWPHLKHALRNAGKHLPDNTPASELRRICAELLHAPSNV